MDPASILADVQLAISLGKMAYDLEQNIAPYLITAYQIVFENKVLTADERAAMRAKEVDMRAQIDAVIATDDSATD